MSAAGPLSNILLFLLIAVVIHPKTGIVDPFDPNPPMWARLLGVLAVLQVFAVFLNLIPVPPLDGFGIIEPFMDEQTRMRLSNPQTRWIGLLLIFLVLFRSERAMQMFMDLIDSVLVRVGLPWDMTWQYFNIAFFGSSE